MKQQSANDHFGSSNGTGQYYRTTHQSIHYTDGVKDLAGKCGAYWLIDLVISHQCRALVAQHPFQVWELKQVTGFEYEAECTDGNGKHITRQRIPFIDFPYQQATLWLVDQILLLPCEY
jgi:hypothetical protein